MEEAEPGLDALGLQPKAFLLLAAVEESPYPAELARILGLPPPTVTYLVKPLEAKNYLLRTKEPGDLRRFRLALTDEGREAVRLGTAAIHAAFEERQRRLRPEEVQGFDQLVQRLASTDPGPA